MPHGFKLVKLALHVTESLHPREQSPIHNWAVSTHNRRSIPLINIPCELEQGRKQALPPAQRFRNIVESGSMAASDAVPRWAFDIWCHMGTGDKGGPFLLFI